MDNHNLTKTNSFSGYFLMVVYFCGVLLVGFTAARIGLSQYYGAATVEGISDSDAAKAIFFDPANPEVYRNRGMFALRNQDFLNAAGSFQRAVELREYDFLLWLRLGHALTRLKEFGAARKAYQTSISLAPNYAQPNKHLGLMLLETGAREEAFKYLSKAAEHDISLYPEILQLAREHYPGDPVAMERAINPTSAEARKLAARYLIKYYFMTDVVKEFLSGNELTDAEKNDFIRYLIYKKNPQVAYDTWLSKSVTASAKPTADDPVFDGGFEIITSSDDSGFGWQIDQEVSNTAVAIDNKLFHTGARSLFIRFAGSADTGRKIISQLVVLKPYQNYRLTFSVLSPELTSGGLPVVLVKTGSSSPPVTSALIKATDNKWVQLTVDFKTNEESAASVSLQRARCDPNPCPIFGELSLDDFSIKEIGRLN